MVQLDCRRKASQVLRPCESPENEEVLFRADSEQGLPIYLIVSFERNLISQFSCPERTEEDPRQITQPLVSLMHDPIGPLPIRASQGPRILPGVHSPHQFIH